MSNGALHAARWPAVIAGGFSRNKSEELQPHNWGFSDYGSFSINA